MAAVLLDVRSQGPYEDLWKNTLFFSRDRLNYALPN